MNSFTARYTQADYESINSFRGIKPSSSRDSRGNITEADRYKLLSTRERTQILELLKHAVEKDYFYPFIYRVTTKGDKYLSSQNLSVASRRLYGFNVAELIDLRNVEVANKPYYDQALFDFIELMLIFAIPAKGRDLAARIQQVFDDKGAPFVIRDHLIVAKNVGGLASLAPLMKDRLLKDKLERLLSSGTEDTDDIALATIAAEITQNVYSSAEKGDKTEVVALCKKVASRWSSAEKADELSDLISETVLTIKKWNNTVADVRHTDKSTVYVSSPSIYRLIYKLNEAIAEFTITTMQDTFMSEKKSEDIALAYAKDWDVDLQKEELYTAEDEPIDLSSIPF